MPACLLMLDLSVVASTAAGLRQAGQGRTGAARRQGLRQGWRGVQVQYTGGACSTAGPHPRTGHMLSLLATLCLIKTKACFAEHCACPRWHMRARCCCFITAAWCRASCDLSVCSVGDHVFLSPQLFDQLEDKQEINLPEYLKNSKFHKASSAVLNCCWPHLPVCP